MEPTMQADLFGSAPTFKARGDLAIEQGDALAFLRSIPTGSVDLVATDLPYPSLEKHRARGTTTRLKQSTSSSNVWFPTMSNADIRVVVEETARILAPGRHAYFVADEETTDAMKRYAWDAGLYSWGTLTWIKTRNGKIRFGMGYHYRRCDERILFLEKRTTSKPPKFNVPLHEVVDTMGGYPLPWGQGRKLNDLGIPNAVAHDEPLDERPNVITLDGVTGYPTEKPVELLRMLVAQSTNPGEVVVDPTCGSGTTLAGALLSGCRAWVNDLGDEAVRLTTERARAHRP